MLYVVQFLNATIQHLHISAVGDLAYLLMRRLQDSSEDLMTHIYLTFETLMANRPLTTDISEQLLKEFIHG